MRGNGRVISRALVSAGVCSALTLAAISAGAGQAAAAPAGTRSLALCTPAGASRTVPVIIFLKNQWAGAGSRIRSGKRFALIQAAQAPYLGQLQALGATGVTGYRLVDAIAARVPAAALGAITASPGVASVIPDSPIIGPTPPARPGRPFRGEDRHDEDPAGGMLGHPAARAGGARADPHRLRGEERGNRAVARLHRRGRQGRVPRRRYRPGQRQPDARRQAGDQRLQGLQRRRDERGDGGRRGVPRRQCDRRAGSPVYNVAGFSAQVPSAPCRIRIEGRHPGFLSSP